MAGTIRTTTIGVALGGVCAALAVAADTARDAEDAAFPKGVVLYLSFDESTFCKDGDDIRALDLSGKGNHATVHGAVPEVGRFGGALSFNGADSFLEGSDAALPIRTEASTVSLWVQPRKNQFSGLFAYGFKGKHTARGLAVNPASTVCYFRWQDGPSHWKTQLPLDEWRHLAVVYNGKESILYIDGAPQGAIEREFNTYREKYIVGRNLNVRDWFDGLIDEVAVFDRALSEEEIRGLYQRKPQPAPKKFDLDSIPVCQPAARKE